jgi:hypothetical protein
MKREGKKERAGCMWCIQQGDSIINERLKSQVRADLPLSHIWTRSRAKFAAARRRRHSCDGDTHVRAPACVGAHIMGAREKNRSDMLALLAL